MSENEMNPGILVVPDWLIGSVESILDGLAYIEGYVTALEETRTIQPSASDLNGQTRLRQLVTKVTANAKALRGGIKKKA